MAQGTMKFNLVLAFAVCAAALLGGWLGTLAADREIPVAIYSAEPKTSLVKPGENLKIEYAVYRRRSCEVQIDRFILDNAKVRWTLPDTDIASGLPLGEDHYIIPVEIPGGVAMGPAMYRTLSTYVCNPLQRIWPISGGVHDVRFMVE